MNNFRQIGIALHRYHDAYGSFPPAYVADSKGRAMHSWRVLILPYLDQAALYDRYRFDEPWDGPNNSQLASELPFWRYHCPAEAGDVTMTSYIAVVGPQTAWPRGEPTTRDDFPDGISTTLHVVEVANSGIRWMEPRDLYIGQMAPTINPKSGQGISSIHGPVDGVGLGATVVFADGGVKYLFEAETTSEKLRAMLTRNGGEHIGEF